MTLIYLFFRKPTRMKRKQRARKQNPAKLPRSLAVNHKILPASVTGTAQGNLSTVACRCHHTTPSFWSNSISSTWNNCRHTELYIYLHRLICFCILKQKKFGKVGSLKVAVLNQFYCVK